MTAFSDEEKKFLISLFEQTIDKSASQASMYDIGADLGMERDESLRTAESLMSNSLVEVKTLSGGIGLTDDGLKAVKKLGVGKGSAGIVLGDDPLMEKEQCDAVESVCAVLKGQLGKTGLSYELLDEVVADLKTIDMQLISPKPKTAVFRTCLAAVKAAVASAGPTREVADHIGQLLGE